MDFKEFKAWVDGYMEGIEGKTPTKKQWEKIKEKLENANGCGCWHPYTWITHNEPWKITYIDRTVPVIPTILTAPTITWQVGDDLSKINNCQSSNDVKTQIRNCLSPEITFESN